METIFKSSFISEYKVSLLDYCDKSGSFSLDLELPLFVKTALAFNHPLGEQLMKLKYSTKENLFFKLNSSEEGSLEEFEYLYQQAVSILRKNWPFVYDLFLSTVYGLSIVEVGKSEESYSSPKLFGLIFYNMKSKDPLKWAEILVHELSHQILFAGTALEGFLPEIDWGKSVFSNLRNENRPLIGVLHAVVAEAFMLRLAFLTEKRKPILNYQRILTNYSEKFKSDLKTLRHYIDIQLLDKYIFCLLNWVDKSINEYGTR